MSTSAAASGSATPARPPRRARRASIPGLLLLLVLGAVGYVWVRGTWADSTPADPKSVADGPVCHVYQPAGEHKRVRCAVLLPYPMQKVWSVVTDYEHYADILPYLADVQVEPKEGEKGVWHMTGKAKSALPGYWDFAIDIHQEEGTERRVAWWDNPSGEVTLNKGRWELTPDGPDRTLLVLSLEAEVHNYPTFFLRNYFLHRLKRVVQAVEQQLQKQPAGD
jgi:ribosome-associated toxin RatA of RatAB toxin-antitoxin module